MFDTPTPVPKPIFNGRAWTSPMRGKPLLGQNNNEVQEIVARCLKQGVIDTGTNMRYRVSLADNVPEAALMDFVRRIRIGGESDYDLMRDALGRRMISMVCVPNPKQPEPEVTHFRHGRK